MVRLKLTILAVILLTLQACASIIDGATQTIAVESTPAEADCRFVREGAVVAYVTTPGDVEVEKTKHDMTVECEKDGYEVTRANLDSGIAAATWGNIIFGGGLGWAIDSAAGADNKYPEYINLTLAPKEGGASTLQASGHTVSQSSALQGGEKWVGRSPQDTCGNQWAMDLEVRGRDLVGTVWRDEVEYAVRGSVGISGEVIKARGAKRQGHGGVPAPRFLSINLTFDGNQAYGEFGVDSYGRLECVSPIQLSRF